MWHYLRPTHSQAEPYTLDTYAHPAPRQSRPHRQIADEYARLFVRSEAIQSDFTALHSIESMATDAQQEETRPVFMTRGYQQELLEESLRRNVIIALDTGSGKTHIAMLRMKHEVEHNSKKVSHLRCVGLVAHSYIRNYKISWFLAPTVALIEQQRDVIASSIPVSVGLISGAREPDQWKNAALWSKVLAEHRIMISTPQILLDALRHGYIQLGRDISLLVFDEAHHATSKHPYNEIMKGFYRPLPPREGRDAQSIVRPAILGLTASPIYGGDIGKAFRSVAYTSCLIGVVDNSPQ